MTFVVLGLLAALLWGVGDALGGFATRRAPVAAVVVTAQAVGLVAIGAAIVLTGEAWPGTPTFLVAMAGGAAAGMGVAMLYRALATGVMGVVAPIAATGVLIPVTVGLADGERPGAVAAVGACLALVGVVAALRDGGGGRGSRTPALLALGAAAGFGTFHVILSRVAPGGALWAVAGARTASIPLVTIAALTVGMSVRAPRRALLIVPAAGMCDASGVLAFASATTRGPLSVAGVLGALYPLFTTAAAALAGERMTRRRWMGTGLAMTGVLLIASGL